MQCPFYRSQPQREPKLARWKGARSFFGSGEELNLKGPTLAKIALLSLEMGELNDVLGAFFIGKDFDVILALFAHNLNNNLLRLGARSFTGKVEGCKGV